MTDHNRPFSDAERAGLYRAIYERRDVRSQFLPDPIPRPVLARLLKAAHHAPSVGFMQPWDFILIDSLELRQQVLASYHEENAKAADNYSGERQHTYRNLKLQGRSEEHTSELQSRPHLVCRLLLEKKKKHNSQVCINTTIAIH